MKRVAVVGPGGAGKSTLARELGRRTGIPVIHLDRHHWKPGWIATPPEEWRAMQSDLLAGDAWTVDGNYGATFDVRFARADTVIVLAPPRLRCLTRALRRVLKQQGLAVQAPGCPERLNLTFLKWVWRYPRDSRPRLDAALDRHRANLRVIELTSSAQGGKFLRDVGVGVGIGSVRLAARTRRHQPEDLGSAIVRAEKKIGTRSYTGCCSASSWVARGSSTASI